MDQVLSCVALIEQQKSRWAQKQISIKISALGILAKCIGSISFASSGEQPSSFVVTIILIFTHLLSTAADSMKKNSDNSQQYFSSIQSIVKSKYPHLSHWNIHNGALLWFSFTLIVAERRSGINFSGNTKAAINLIFFYCKTNGKLVRGMEMQPSQVKRKAVRVTRKSNCSLKFCGLNLPLRQNHDS